MSQKIIECIPNFSEGRRMKVIEAIESEIAAVTNVLLLDRHSDGDHNRSVITFAGPPEAVLEAAFASISKAAKLINLDQHQGEHPRIGATDVVPFVPISGVSMDECVEIARQLGKRVGEELDIPVYLYERAATRPDRVHLEKIRHGEYEGLKESIGEDPDRIPDFGPAKLGTAGATVIGARPILIAYNVYLTTDEVGIAEKIARSVRHSSGGLRYVKAKGMLVDGQAQVSMNLTDYTRTPIARAVEMIRAEAIRHGVAMDRSELVGLIPQAALIDAARWYLQLDPFKSEQVLEANLYSAMESGGTTEPSFLDQLANGTPTPGGGSAAASAGAMGAALVAMVARLTLNKKKYADVQDRMKDIVKKAEELRNTLDRAVTLDAKAYDLVVEANRMPKHSKVERTARLNAIENATQKAGEVPLEVASLALEVLDLAVEVAEKGNVHAASDAGSAAALARASLRGAGLNVRINANSLSDQAIAEGWRKELASLEAKAEAAETRLQETLKERSNLEY